MGNKEVSRRNFLKILGAGGSAVYFSGLISACSPKKLVSNVPFSGDPDIELSITAAPETIQILEGKKTSVWKYSGEVIQGSQDVLQAVPESYLGPIIRAKKGQKIRIHFTNKISEPTIIHWHGLHVPESADGHPQLAIDHGETYVYDFVVMDRAGTYWFHPHPHGRTGPQVYYGLAGLFIVTDDEEKSLALPSGEYDIPLIIQDRTIDSDNQFVYDLRGAMMTGFMGDRYLVNGKPEVEISAATRPYRLRLLNGSNARIYILAWEDGRPFTIIGTDGGLLDKPIQRNFLVMAPAQRLDLWLDLADQEVGDQLRLLNISSDAKSEDLKQPILTVNIERNETGAEKIPAALSNLYLTKETDAVNQENPREFILSMGMGMQWFINGRTFEMTDVDKNEQVKLGDMEVWQFTNQPGHGMMGLMPHPMHVHGLQFQVLERNYHPDYQDRYKDIHEGLIDEGWHDTVLVLPGERVKILLKFEDFKGLYLYHCHNLEHEDMGMMRNYRVF